MTAAATIGQWLIGIVFGVLMAVALWRNRKMARELAEGKRAEEALKRIEWLLSRSVTERDAPDADYRPPYGDVTALNTCRLILDGVGPDMLRRIAEDAIDLLDTSVAVYEKNGDYAFGMFSSGWCRLMDLASRNLCDTDDNQEALKCGRWLCHENCWNDSAKAAMMSKQPTDIECVGGIRLYSVPIFAGDDVVGVINIGYGDPPADDGTLRKLADRFGVSLETLREHQRGYPSHPPYIVDLAKKRLRTTAVLIGEIVERKRSERALRESEAQKQAILDGISVNIAFVNENLEILWLNKAAAASVGRSKDAMTGRRCHEFWADPEKPCDNCPTLKAIHTRRSEHVTIETPDGRIWDEKGEPVFGPDGHLIGVVEIAEDITDRKRMEADLQAYSAGLEEMVADRTRELGKAQEELLIRERLAVLGHFAGGISHELRNPLGAIDASIYYLQMKLGTGDEKIADHLARVRTNIDRSTAIIESLLNLSRMEKPRTRPHAVDRLITDILRAAIIPETVRTETIFPENEVVVEVDADQVRMAIKNIVHNAVQAMEGTGALTVEVRPPDEGRVEIRISDTGPGIAPENREKIFQPLFSTKVHGIGFGLSIAKMIVENHGGAIRVETPLGGGARFVMTFPRQQTYEVLKTSQVSTEGGRSND